MGSISTAQAPEAPEAPLFSQMIFHRDNIRDHPCPPVVLQTVSLRGQCLHTAPPHGSKCRESPGSLHSHRGPPGGRLPAPPPGLSQGAEAGTLGVYPLTQGLPSGRLPHNTSESPQGCPRPADPSLRVPAGPRRPRPRLPGPQGAGRGSGTGGLYTANPAPPMAAREPACWGQAPGAGGAGGAAG